MNTKPDEPQEETLCVTPQWGDIPQTMRHAGQMWARPHPEMTVIPEEWVQCMTAHGRIVLCDVYFPFHGTFGGGAVYSPLTWDTLPIMEKEAMK